MTNTNSTPANPVQVTDAGEGRYRKKPVVIEAFQMTKERRMDNSDWPNWLHRAWNGARNEAGTLQRVDMGAPLPDLLQIVTLEGLHLVSWGDWIIQGVKGELYPCKPDIFEATYEPAFTAAIGAGGQAVAVKPLDDDQIMEIIKEVAPWKHEPKLNDLLTYEKSPPLFPQATYDVPSYRAVNFVRAVEKRLSALSRPSASGSWKRS